MAALSEHLKLERASRGTNVFVAVPKDDGVFIDSYEPAPDVRSTGLIQTYLDLSQAGDRGREAAEHLRKIRLEATMVDAPITQPLTAEDYEDRASVHAHRA